MTIKSPPSASGQTILNALVNSGALSASTTPRALLSQVQAYCTAQGIPLPVCNLSPRSAFSDTGIATAAVDGGAVGSLRDLTGNGFNGSQASASYQPKLWKQGIGGNPGLDFYTSNNGNGQQNAFITVSGVFAATGFSAGFTIYQVASFNRVFPSAADWILGSFNSSTNYIASGTSADVKGLFNNTNLNFTSENNYYPEYGGVHVASWDGTTATVGINGRYKSGAAAGTVPTSGDYTLGNLPSGHYFGWPSGLLGEFFLFPGVHTAAQMDAIGAIIAADSGLVKPSWVFIGDSITQGTGVGTGVASTNINTWPYKVCALLGSVISAPPNVSPPSFKDSIRYANLGIGGETVATMLSNAQTIPYQYAQYMSPVRGNNNIAFVFGGTNDIVISGSTAAQTFASLQALCALYKSLGATVAVGTMLPRGSTYEATRVAYNNLIRAAGSSLYDILLDFAACPITGQAGQNTNATYYQGDTIHPTDQGHTVLAQIAAEAVAVYKSSSLLSASSTNPPIDVSSLNGTTAGWLTWFMSDQRTSSKKFVANFNGYENNSATNQTVTFPTPFINTPTVVANDSGLTVSASTTTFTITAPNNTTTFTGNVIIEGF